MRPGLTGSCEQCRCPPSPSSQPAPYSAGFHWWQRWLRHVIFTWFSGLLVGCSIYPYAGAAMLPHFVAIAAVPSAVLECSWSSASKSSRTVGSEACALRTSVGTSGTARQVGPVTATKHFVVPRNLLVPKRNLAGIQGHQSVLNNTFQCPKKHFSAKKTF